MWKFHREVEILKTVLFFNVVEFPQWWKVLRSASQLPELVEVVLTLV